jgi:hypothetical protein
MNESDLQLKLLIAFITLMFTIIIGIAGYLVKKLIEDMGRKLDAIIVDQKDDKRITNEHAVEIAKHKIKIEYLEASFKTISSEKIK